MLNSMRQNYFKFKVGTILWRPGEKHRYRGIKILDLIHDNKEFLYRIQYLDTYEKDSIEADYLERFYSVKVYYHDIWQELNQI